MKNALLLCVLACALTFGRLAAQESPAKTTSAPVDASGKEAVTRTRSKPSTAGKPVEAPVATSPENAEPLRAVPAAQPAPAAQKPDVPAAPFTSAIPNAPAASATVPGRPSSAPPAARK